MNRTTCAGTRATLLSGGDAAAHVAACPACAAFAATLRRVDDALGDDAARVATASLPAGLRARILAAARTPPPVSRRRPWLLEWSLRGAAAAAALVAALSLLPEPLLAAEIGEPSLTLPSFAFVDALAVRLSHLAELPAAPPAIPEETATWPVAAAAAALLALAAWTSRRRSP